MLSALYEASSADWPQGPRPRPSLMIDRENRHMSGGSVVLSHDVQVCGTKRFRTKPILCQDRSRDYCGPIRDEDRNRKEKDVGVGVRFRVKVGVCQDSNPQPLGQ